jgi:dipeptidyl aminopeptidase/acylaminoacyl peptidase
MLNLKTAASALAVGVALSAAFALQAIPAHAQAPASAPAKLTVEDFFKHPQFRGVSLSPNGEYLAATAPIQGRMNLVAMSLKDRKPMVLTSNTNFDIVQFSWVNNDRLVFSVGNINEPSASEARRGGGLFAINRDGTEARTLSATVGQAIARGEMVYRSANFVSRTPELSDDIIVAANERSADQADLYLMNTKTGRKTLISFDNPGRVAGWVLDKKGVVRAASSMDDENTLTTWYRKDADSKWQQMGVYKLFEKNIMPLAFGYDGTFYVISNVGRDKYAIYTYDVDKGALKDLVFEHADVDVGVDNSGSNPSPSKLVWDSHTKKLIGVRYEADKPGVKWLDEGWQKFASHMDAALPGHANVFAPMRDTDRMIVGSYSDRASASWYLYDHKAKTLESLVSMRNWLKPSDMVEMKPVRYKARDGMEIPAYLFLPKGKEAKNLPLVINIHGGPMVRADVWGLEMWGPMESQFLAYHGYAVLLPNFRMTPGFGHKHYTGGLRQFGHAMQDDIEDGADYLVKQGIVDTNRICLYGASYGGYSTLWGLVKTPDRYKCGVAALVVADVELQLNSTLTDFSSSKSAIHFWSKMAGDPKTEKEYLRSISPAYHADKIKAPLFIIAGRDDRRTPLEQAEKMRAALEKVGKNPEWMVKAEEGHGFAKTENRVDMYTQMLAFFNKHIGTAK